MMAALAAVTLLFLGCFSAAARGAGVSRLQSADVPLALAGPKAPPGSPPAGLWDWSELHVTLQEVTDGILAGLLPALPDRRTSLNITGEQRRHRRLTVHR